MALDLAQAMEMTGGDPEFLREILEEFVQHSERQIGTLKAAQAEGNKEKIRFEAHAIKGSSATVGATQLSVVSLNLEQVAAGTKSGDLKALVADLEAEFQRVKKFIGEYLASGKSSEPAIDVEKALEMTGGDTQFLKEILDEFVQHSVGQIRNLEAALAQKNMQTVRFEAHTIKGSAATIGATKVSEAALKLERCASGEAGDVHELFTLLSSEFGRVREFASTYKG